jgi:hypothetical protein
MRNIIELLLYLHHPPIVYIVNDGFLNVRRLSEMVSTKHVIGSQWLIAQLVEHSLSVMKDPVQISARTFVGFVIDL